MSDDTTTTTSSSGESMDSPTTGHTRVTVDLEDRINEYEEAQELIDAILAGDHESLENPELVDESLGELERDELRRRKHQLQHQQELVRADIQRFDGSEFTVKKFRAGDAERVNDLVLEETLGDGNQDPRAKLGARKLHTIEVGVVAAPSGTPDDAKQFETPTAEYLYSAIENLNTYGQVSLPDF